MVEYHIAAPEVKLAQRGWPCSIPKVLEGKHFALTFFRPDPFFVSKGLLFKRKGATPTLLEVKYAPDTIKTLVMRF